jgi:hypothetical protein
MIAFIAELNDLKLWATDIGNAYLESWTSESVASLLDLNLELQGHLMLIKGILWPKVIWARWHERLCCFEGHGLLAMLTLMWMKHMGDHYDYIGVYVDDLETPQRILKPSSTHLWESIIQAQGSGTLPLRCEFYRDDEGVLNQSARKYIGQDDWTTHTRMFKKPPKSSRRHWRKVITQ